MAVSDSNHRQLTQRDRHGERGRGSPPLPRRAREREREGERERSKGEERIVNPRRFMPKTQCRNIVQRKTIDHPLDLVDETPSLPTTCRLLVACVCLTTSNWSL